MSIIFFRLKSLSMILLVGLFKKFIIMFSEKLENNFSLEAPKNQESLKNQIDSNDMKEYDLQKIINIIIKKEIDLSRPYDNLFVKRYEILIKDRGNDLS